MPAGTSFVSTAAVTEARERASIYLGQEHKPGLARAVGLHLLCVRSELRQAPAWDEKRTGPFSASATEAGSEACQTAVRPPRAPLRFGSFCRTAQRSG